LISKISQKLSKIYNCNLPLSSLIFKFQPAPWIRIIIRREPSPSMKFADCLHQKMITRLLCVISLITSEKDVN